MIIDDFSFFFFVCADDSLLFAKTASEATSVWKDILRKYELASGHE